MNIYQIPSDPSGNCYEDNINGKRLFEVDTMTFKIPTISHDMSPTRYRKCLHIYFSSNNTRLSVIGVIPYAMVVILSYCLAFLFLVYRMGINAGVAKRFLRVNFTERSLNVRNPVPETVKPSVVASTG